AVGDGRLRWADAGVVAVAAVVGGGGHQPPDPVAVQHRHPQRGAAAEAVAEQVDPLAGQLVEQRYDVVREVVQRGVAVDVGGVAVTLQLGGDHLPPGREGGQHGAERVGYRVPV